MIKNRLEGIGWFTYETLKRITARHPEHQFYFIFDRKHDPSFIFSDNVTPVEIGPQARHPILYKWWFNRSIPKVLKRVNADLFLSPDGYLSLKTNVPQVPVMHDLNFEHYPEDLPPHVTKYYTKYFPLFANKAERIITVSQFSKQDIHELYNIPLDKIDVAHNGVNESLHPLEEGEMKNIRDGYSDGKPYFAYVGSLHARKNITRMLQAFDRFKKETNSDYQFVVVGEKIWKSDDMESMMQSLTHKNDIHFTGRVPVELLNNIVASSEGLVYVSYFEGFGIPILEGMKCGVPVITSNITSMPEVAGNAAILVDPFNVESIASGMQELIDPEKQSFYRNAGAERVGRFSWDNTAKAVWDSIEKVL